MADWLPKLYYTDAEIALYMLELESAWSSFAADIDEHGRTTVFNADELDQFEMLDESYAKWKKGLGWWDRSSGGTVTAVKAYAKKLKYWIDLFNQRTGNKSTKTDVGLILAKEDSTPLIAANFSAGDLISKQGADRLQTMVVAVCVAVGLTAIAKTIRG